MKTRSLRIRLSFGLVLASRWLVPGAVASPAVEAPVHRSSSLVAGTPREPDRAGPLSVSPSTIPAEAGGLKSAVSSVAALADWSPPADAREESFVLDAAAPKFLVWGGETVGGAKVKSGSAVRRYFDELLPALFERTLQIEESDASGELAWIFTGERGGFTVTVKPRQVELVRRFYDSTGFNEVAGGLPPRHPEWQTPAVVIAFTGPLRAVTMTLDHRLGLALGLNGREVFREACGLEVSRHQLRLGESRSAWRGRMWSPAPQAVRVVIDATRRRQTMLGFGGIAAPTAYAQLGPGGKRRWWEIVCDYNLLVQREYPIGQRLTTAMDNWDRLADATPHYYGDNFPNGEISDFVYQRTLRRLGGQVWFEFWALPPWVGRDVDT